MHAEQLGADPLESVQQSSEPGLVEPGGENGVSGVVVDGAVTIGAFDGDRLVGSVYGFATHEPHVLHSHYLAVDPDYRARGLAVELKRRQRDWCLDNGRTAMRWTFDPLQLGNAHLNLRSLRAIAVQYHVDFYGPMGGINGRLPSDRLVVEWNLIDESSRGTKSIEIAVPPVSADDIAVASELAMNARVALRDALVPLFADGWQATDVDRAGRTYTLSR